MPLSGPEDDSLEGLGLAFSGLSVGGPEGKKEKEMEEEAVDKEIEEAHPGEETPFEHKLSEGAHIASDHPAVPSPTTTTLPTAHPATSLRTTTPPMVEGLGFTGMPYPTVGAPLAATASPMATAAREPVASSSTYTGMWRCHAYDYHRPADGVYMTGIPAYAAPETGFAAPEAGYHTVPAPGLTSLSGLRGPESCGGRSRGSRRSSNRSLTKSEIQQFLSSELQQADLVGNITQEVWAPLEPLIPPQGTPTTIGPSPHRLQASHLVSGLTNTLGGLRSRPMPTPAMVPRSPFVPRTAQPPYSHLATSTRAELDNLGLIALRAMAAMEPQGSSDLSGDPSDDEQPSLMSASPSEDDDPEDPEDSNGKGKKKKKKTKGRERRRSQEAKAVATSKIVVTFPEFTGKDLSEFAENFGRFLRMTGQTHASGRVKCDLLLQCCKTKYLEKQVKQLVTKSATFADVLVALEKQYPTYETDVSIRGQHHEPASVAEEPQAGQDFRAAGRLGPLGRATDAWFLWQQTGAILFGGQAPTRTVG